MWTNHKKKMQTKMIIMITFQSQKIDKISKSIHQIKTMTKLLNHNKMHQQTIYSHLKILKSKNLFKSITNNN